MRRPRVVLRCDARSETGLGHMVRCLAVADAAQAAGWSVVLAGSIEPSSLVDRLLSQAGLEAVPLAGGSHDLVKFAALHGADVCHVDHYDMAPSLRKQLTDLGVLLSNVEDGEYGRRPADFAIDATLGAESQDRPADGSAVQLRGLEFALFRQSVLRARRAREVRGGPSSAQGTGVLVVMGGSDPTGALGPVTDHLLSSAKAGMGTCLTVIDPSAVARTEANVDGFVVRRVPPVVDLPGLAATADLVVTAAGTTVWELVALGVPLAVVRVVENQAVGYDSVVESGFAIGLGSPEALVGKAELAAALTRRTTSSTTLESPRLGRGAERLVDIWTKALRSPRWRARPAQASDADLLLSWRNDPGTRRWSRTAGVVTREHHVNWLNAARGSEACELLIVERDGVPAGTVRWDRLDGFDWEVSITVDPLLRGRSTGTTALDVGQRWLAAWVDEPLRAVARLRPENVASARLFSRSGYARAPELDQPPFLAYRRWLRTGEGAAIGTAPT